MLASLSRHPGSVFLLLSAFHVGGVLGRGGRGGSIGHAIGDDVGDSNSSLDLSPRMTAIFAITIVIAVITLYQLGRAVARFKKPVLPADEPTLPYDVGLLFRILLCSYLVVYLLYNILYAVYIATVASSLSLISQRFDIGTSSVAQLAEVLLFATVLSIITYRQRVQLNPGEKRFSLKSFLDGWVLSTILILSIAQDAVAGTAVSTAKSIVALNISIAAQVFVFVASVDVAVSAFMARARLARAGIQDKIIWMAAFLVSPVLLIGAVYRIIRSCLTRSLVLWFIRQALIIADIEALIIAEFEALMIADTVTTGCVSIFVVACCLLMGASPKPPTKDAQGHKG